MILADVATVERPPALHRQIRQTLREAIISGELTPGTRLPSSRELADQFGAAVGTVQAALAALAEEGLVERSPRRGTFVTGGTVQLTSAAIYLSSQLWQSSVYGFTQALYQAVSKRLTAVGAEPRLFVDSCSDGENASLPPALLGAVEARKVQALLEILPPATVVAEDLRQLGIPVAIYSGYDTEFSVTSDWDGMFATLLQYWQSRGVRSAGVINQAPQMRPWLTRLATNAAAVGIEMRADWLRSPATRQPPATYERFGYEQFKALWNLPKRPEALFVHADAPSRGVVTAALECRVRVPEDLDLTIYENARLPVLCPYPAARVGGAAEDVADALMDQLRDQLAGRPPRHRYLPLSLNPPTT